MYGIFTIIYLHLVDVYGKGIGKYKPYMDGMGYIISYQTPLFVGFWTETYFGTTSSNKLAEGRHCECTAIRGSWGGCLDPEGKMIYTPKD